MKNKLLNNHSQGEMLNEKIAILLIDEDPVSCKMISTSLKKIPNKFYQLEVSKEYREGAAKAITDQFDCIITNNVFKEESSIDLLKHIEEHNLLKKIPVIVFTESDDHLIIARALKAGASDYLLKDKINTATLKKSIDNVVNEARMRAELSDKNEILDKTNKHLKEKTEELEAFYHNVSHELKTPLTSMREFSSMLIDEVSGPLNSAQKEYAQICIDSCDRASNYINSLLDLIRCDSGQLSLNVSEVSIKSMIDEVIAQAKSKSVPNSLKIKYSIRTKKEFIVIDKSKIFHVLTNLINNAVKNSNEDGVITLTVRDVLPKKDSLVITVKDNGCGIHPNKLDHIFDRYFQLENLAPGEYQPLEMGLYLCQKIIELHGGEVFVESGLGVGSTFTLSLPCKVKKNNTYTLIPTQMNG